MCSVTPRLDLDIGDLGETQRECRDGSRPLEGRIDGDARALLTNGYADAGAEIAGAKRRKIKRRAIGDGDVQTACQQSCPTGAITFGDLMDPDSGVSRLLKSPRAYQVLAELGTRPNVGYLKRIRRPLPIGGEKP